ncbi:MAG TPA: transglycosylase domain-containing protein [Chryseosolibacter sp.]
MRIKKGEVKSRLAGAIKFVGRKAQPLVDFLARYIKVLEDNKRLRLAAIAAAVVFIPLVILMLVVLLEVPTNKELRKIQNPIASEVYTADSVLIGRYFIQNRTQVNYEDISPNIINALIATEDIRFFNHGGVDFRSLGRVFVKTLLMQNESSGGGSTITQQLAKNLYPRKEFLMGSMIVNKLREVVIARRLESLYSKEQILALYLNTIPFGDNTYGIQAAAHRFFSTTAKDIKPQDAAVLVGMLKATHSYNPRLFPDNARGRRNVVLSQMTKYNMITKETRDSLKALPLGLKFSVARKETEVAPYFRENLKAELQQWFNENKKRDGSHYNLYTDGLKIYTTIDSKLQAYAEKAISKQMTELQKQFFSHWSKEKPWGSNDQVVIDAARRTTRYKELKRAGMDEAEILNEMSKPVLTQLFSWDGPKEANVSPLDSIRHHLQFLNAGFLAMDPSSGEVKAWVGGINHDFFQYDHVRVATKRQVGSIFKPLVYAAALEEGISPCEFISAGQETYIDDEGEEWTPKNSNYDYPVSYSMRGALAYSVNTVSVKLINRAGIDNTIELARRMGIRSEIPDVPSIALGSSALSLMEMTGAYAAIANEGVSSFPFFIKSIQDREGNVLNDFKPEVSGKRVMSAETAQLVRQMMKTVVDEGTASRLRWRYGVYNDVAGKTGTTQANADGWFMAITPKLVMGSWVGADDPRIRFRNTELGQGANTALPLVAYFLKNVNSDKRYAAITKAKFSPISPSARRKLGCDLYEINDNLWAQIEKTVHQRDSIIQADTLAIPPPQTFLQTLYLRKQKVLLASQSAMNTDNEDGRESPSGIDR